MIEAVRATELEIPPPIAKFLADAIRGAGGNEVFFLGRVKWAEGRDVAILDDVDVVARGDASSVPAIIRDADDWDLAIHNHPGGDLTPSHADMEIAYILGNRSVGFAIIDNAANEHYLVIPPFRRTGRNFVDPAQIEWIFGANGPIARALDGFRERSGQIAMALEVTRALNENGVVALEAATGVGKSFAYLVPAILWAVANRERVIVSTGTIHLQEQLAHKDLPFLAKVLDIPFRYALAKGRNQYACRRKLSEIPAELQLRPPPEADRLALEELVAWGEATSDGSRADLATEPRREIWEQVMSETDRSLKAKCPFYTSCFFYEAKRAANRTHILVVNHHLFFADLAVRRETGDFDQDLILPRYKRVVFDEAHHLEDVASEHLSARFSRRGIAIRLGRMMSRDGQRGRLPVLVEKIASDGDSMAASRIARMLGDAIRSGGAQIDHLFELLDNEVGVVLGPGERAAFPGFLDATSRDPDRLKLRYRPGSSQEDLWRSARDLLLSVRGELARIAVAASRSAGALDESFADDDTKASVELELESFASRVEGVVESIGRFCELEDETRVRWIDPLEGASRRDGGTLAFSAAPIRISRELAKTLFEPLETVILTSATLSVDGSPAFLADRLGLDLLPEDRFRFESYDSPYDYQEQVLTVVPSDVADPGSPGFERELAETVFQIVSATRGRAFVLFTSYRLLRRTHETLEERLRAIGIRTLVQGEAQRSELLRRFRDGPNNVLFGTDSFWEGVDVPGRALECVIITRLPFRVPTDPLNEARVEEIRSRGRDPFRTLSVPQAVLRFKQGFGRLIRTETDRGVVAVLDPRVIQKSYGRMFLRSVPKTAFIAEPVDRVVEAVERFFAE